MPGAGVYDPFATGQARALQRRRLHTVSARITPVGQLSIVRTTRYHLAISEKGRADRWPEPPAAVIFDETFLEPCIPEWAPGTDLAPF